MTKPVKAGSQAARILHALGSSGKWVSVAEIQRHAGNSRLNSRISDLRKKGYKIEHRVVSGKPLATYRHQYKLIDPPLPLPDPGAIPRDDLDRDRVPRDKKHRYRIYIVTEVNELKLMATAASEEEVGVKICRLGREGKVSRACFGILDTYGLDKKAAPGLWLVNPWDAKVS